VFAETSRSTSNFKLVKNTFIKLCAKTVASVLLVLHSFVSNLVKAFNMFRSIKNDSAKVKLF
jgi:hypothetical protein